jgi:AraC-like DNA-binding protein
MDILADILRITRLTGDVFSHLMCEPPWGLRVEPGPVVRFHMVAAGHARLVLPRRERAGRGTIDLAAHDLVLLPHGGGHVLCDEPTSPTVDLASFLARERAARGPTPPNEPFLLSASRRRGSRPRSELVCGRYTVMFAERHPVLRLLPEVIHIPAREAMGHAGIQSTLGQLLREIVDRDVGTERVIASLLEVLFVHILRHWIDSNPESATGWLGALRDDAIGRALVELHTAPAKAWTVASLARAVGMSRAALARRFTAKVGEPPLAYLRKLRLGMSMRELAETSRPIVEIASSFGYASQFAFNRAFRQLHGVPPGTFRRTSAMASSP